MNIKNKKSRSFYKKKKEIEKVPLFKIDISEMKREEILKQIKEKKNCNANNNNGCRKSKVKDNTNEQLNTEPNKVGVNPLNITYKSLYLYSDRYLKKKTEKNLSCFNNSRNNSSDINIINKNINTSEQVNSKQKPMLLLNSFENNNIHLQYNENKNHDNHQISSSNIKNLNYVNNEINNINDINCNEHNNININANNTNNINSNIIDHTYDNGNNNNTENELAQINNNDDYDSNNNENNINAKNENIFTCSKGNKLNNSKLSFCSYHSKNRDHNLRDVNNNESKINFECRRINSKKSKDIEYSNEITDENKKNYNPFFLQSHIKFSNRTYTNKWNIHKKEKPVTTINLQKLNVFNIGYKQNKCFKRSCSVISQVAEDLIAKKNKMIIDIFEKSNIKVIF